MWPPFWPCLRGLSLDRGERMLGYGVPIIWRDSRVTLSFVAFLILLPQMSRFILLYRGLRFLGKLSSLLGKFYMEELTLWIVL